MSSLAYTRMKKSRPWHGVADRCYWISLDIMNRYVRMGGTVWREDMDGLARKVSKRISGTVNQTAKSVMSHHGWGRYRGPLGWDVSVDDDINNRYSPYNYSLVMTKQEKNNPWVKAVESYKAIEYSENYYVRMERYEIRRKTVTAVSFCVYCGKVYKAVRSGGGYTCRSCTAKSIYVRKGLNEAAEVNRLLNKLKKGIKHESERLEKETA